MPIPLKIRFHEVKPKRPVFITDIDDLNYIVAIGRLVCDGPPDTGRIEQLRRAIADAEAGINPDCPWCVGPASGPPVKSHKICERHARELRGEI